MVDMVNPQLGETVLDPACGTGGFLVCTIDHLRNHVKTPDDEELLQRSVQGIEKKPLPHLLHGIDVPTNVRHDNTGVKPTIKERLLTECNLHTIVRLPNGVFAPYTGIKTNLLFFIKSQPTKEIWYYEHPYLAGAKSYNKTKPIRMEEFDAEKVWWFARGGHFPGRRFPGGRFPGGRGSCRAACETIL